MRNESQRGVELVLVTMERDAECGKLLVMIYRKGIRTVMPNWAGGGGEGS